MTLCCRLDNNGELYSLLCQPHKQDHVIKAILATACIVSGLFFLPVVNADSRRAEALALTCFTCHSGGHDDAGGIPSLENLSRDELTRRLQAFRDGRAEATVMDRISAAYTDEEIAIIADYITGRRESQ